jgi:hypothetical protein
MTAPDSIDTASVVYNFLKTDADGADVRALLASGASSVIEAGLVNASTIQTAYTARLALTPSGVGKALIIIVRDAGEVPEGPGMSTETVAIDILDIGQGYRNIRGVQQKLRKVLLQPHVVNVVANGDAVRGILQLTFGGRTGHRFDETFSVEFETIVFQAQVETEWL